MSQVLGKEVPEFPADEPAIYAGLTAIRAWHVVRVENGKPVISAKCPGCGNSHELDHEIDSSGVIKPSLDCPSCDFHEMTYLSSWK